MKILLIDLNNYFQCGILIKLMLLLSILLSFSTFSTFCEGRKLSQLSHRPITPGFLCSSFCFTISLFQFAQKFALNRSRLKTISPNVTRPGAATRWTWSIGRDRALSAWRDRRKRPKTWTRWRRATSPRRSPSKRSCPIKARKTRTMSHWLWRHTMRRMMRYTRIHMVRYSMRHLMGRTILHMKNTMGSSSSTTTSKIQSAKRKQTLSKLSDNQSDSTSNEFKDFSPI